MTRTILGKGRQGATRLAAWIGLVWLFLILAGPALAADKPAQPSSLIREGYGDYGGGGARPEAPGEGGTPSTSLTPDPSAPGGYRLQLVEPGVTELPGQAPSVIPDPSAPGGYRYQPGIPSDPDAAPGQAPRVTPDPNAPGGYRLHPLPGEAEFHGPLATPPGPTAPPATPTAEPDTGLPPSLRWPGEDPEYRQRQEQTRPPNAQAPPRRYPWEPYQDRHSLRWRDQRHQAREQAIEGRGD